MRRILTVSMLTVLAALWTMAAFAAVPQLINFQGILKDGSGNPVADGAYSVQFTIYDAPSAGNIKWQETQSVNTVNGLFSVLLGSTNPVPDSAFNNPDRYLGVKVGADPEMTPRQRLVSLSYAYRVNSVDGASGGTITSKVSIGLGHTNTGTNAFVAGEGNEVSGSYSSVGGGFDNTASGISSTVGGGQKDTAGNTFATVGGGSHNVANGIASTIGGGSNNHSRGDFSTVGGGGGGTSADSNSAFGDYSTVGGGGLNTASGSASTVAGGKNNLARGSHSTIAGGEDNIANNDYGTVGGGNGNTSSGIKSAVGGGWDNVAGAQFAVVAGGYLNNALGFAAAVSGGENNAATGNYAAVAGGGGGIDSGGAANLATGHWSFVGGGAGNRARGDHSVVGGGGSSNPLDSNVAAGTASTVGGGTHNRSSGDYSTIGGGIFNSTGAYGATVPGGFLNEAAGFTSLAAGRRAKALHTGAFVWGDGMDADFASTADNQFLIRAAGGVGIGTNSPGARLHVKGAGFPQAFGFFDTDAASQDAGLRFYEAGVAKSHLYHQASTNTLNLYGEGFSGLSVTSIGRVGIGTAAPAALLHVNGTAGNNTGVWSNLSDRRLKKEIVPLENALETVERLEGVTFRWKDAEKDAQFGRVRGLIAQDVEKVLPEWIKTDPDGYKRIEPIGVDALLIAAIKEQQKEIEELKKEIAELKNRPHPAQAEVR